MLRKTYTHIFFDLDDTIWDFAENSIESLKIAFLHFEIEKKGVGFEQFYGVYSVVNSLLWNQYRNGEINKSELIEKRFQNTFEKLSLSGINPFEMNSHYLDAMPYQKKLTDGAEDLLNYLKKKGYRLSVITNGFKEVQLKKIEQSGLLHFFNKIFISEEVKAHKPSPEIFEYAVKSSNARKSQSLMVGDNYDTDITGALQFGISAAWLNPSQSTQEFKSEKISKNIHFYTLQSLADLKSVL